MESGITKEFTPAVAETQNVANTDSTDSFQSFIYELFEKNGIINDLRAYLRGHIVNVLKSAQTGDPPPCQKNFTQRLEPTYQALNMLIAEYLMRLEFSYSFSVFVSEIPLANMVFGYAKSLMERIDENNAEMRFQDTDVWSILNYLGVQCDSEHASKIVEMYKNEKQHPLLLCILMCMPMYKEYVGTAQVSSEDSDSSIKSLDTAENKVPNTENISLSCKHYVYCKSCQNKMHRLRDKYKKKKKYLVKNVKESTNINPAQTESFIKNMEKRLIEEMFQQLKSVYETEVEMVKVEEEKKIKRSMATHAMQLQRKQNEMEEIFKTREAELERSVHQKKRFLCGLLRALRDQHLHMTRAMHDVRAETERLELKEERLKTHLVEAEQILKKRGEEMRSQISNELSILEGHLESMKRERENITRERTELENIKANTKMVKGFMDSVDVHSHYDLLKNELSILKTYLESSKMQPKCVIERGTVTEPSETVSKINVTLNNSQGTQKSSKSDDFDDRVKTNQVVNDFRKKNVNFSQSNLDEIYRERSQERSRSPNSSEAGDAAAPNLDLERGCDRDLIQRLKDENNRLKAIAKQRPHSQAPRPHTAPPAPAHAAHVYNLNHSASVNTVSVGWRKGAGEELSVFSDAQPRILLPGDTLPFIGVLRDRHGNTRRSQLGQPRGVARARPLAGVIKRTTSPLRERLALGGSGQGLRVSGARLPVASCSLQPDEDTSQHIRDRLQQRQRPALIVEINRNREKSPKSVLREAKQKLRSNDSMRGSPAASRDKSPTAVLREAKLRLRKLEIEAEAVEKSYLDFRRRRSERSTAHDAHVTHDTHDTHKEMARPLDITRSHSKHKPDDTINNYIKPQFADLQQPVHSDFYKYIREYKNKFDIRETHFRNKPTVTQSVKPIPDAYTNCKQYVDAHGNYLETPLTEFRKLYTCARQTRRDHSDIKGTRSVHSDNTSIASNNEFDYENTAQNHAPQKMKHNKLAKLGVLKLNNQLNNNLDCATTDQQVNQNGQTMTKAADENNLKLEVESITEMNDINSQTQEMLVVVQSSVNSKEVKLSGRDAPSDVSAHMTVIVSPELREPRSEQHAGLCAAPDQRVRSEVPEQAAHLTRNDVLDAIFHADSNDVSSVQMPLELSKPALDDSVSESEKGEYPDDFSGDVDNNNSQSDYENNSPISLHKTSEDDNFWES